MKNKPSPKPIVVVTFFALAFAFPISLSAQPPSGDPPPRPTPLPPPTDAPAALPVKPTFFKAKPDPALEAKIDKDPVNNPMAKPDAPLVYTPPATNDKLPLPPSAPAAALEADNALIPPPTDTQSAPPAVNATQQEKPKNAAGPAPAEEKK